MKNLGYYAGSVPAPLLQQVAELNYQQRLELALGLIATAIDGPPEAHS